MKTMKWFAAILNRSLRISTLVFSLVSSFSMMARAGECEGLPDAARLQALLAAAPAAGGDAGGLFHGTRMWGAVVNREGELCAFATSTSDPTQVWPGSQAIAKAKAYTANAFSLDALALSTARLYTFAQPSHSLFGPLLMYMMSGTAREAA